MDHFNRSIILGTLLSLSITLSLQGQSAGSKPDFRPYYFHKVTLFEQLPNTQNEIIWLGDSITDGNEWAELFADQRMKNRGISGDVTDGVLYRLNELTESKPMQIFIMIGVNDLANGVSVDTVLNNYSKIVDRIQKASPGTEIYIQSILPVNDDFDHFTSHNKLGEQINTTNKRLESLAEKRGMAYINLYDEMSRADGKLNPEYTEDGLHLNGKGYVAWKSVVEPYIK